jgi:hypothetical protein
MKKLLMFGLFVLALAFAIPSHAQSTTPITVVSMPGYITNYYYLYNLPLTIGGVTGTAWMDVQGQRGFILFRPPLEGASTNCNGCSGYVLAQITSWTVNSRNSVGLPLSATMTYTTSGSSQPADPNNDGDSDTVVGSITFNYTWQQNPPGYRRGWYATLTGGTGQQSIAQD